MSYWTYVTGIMDACVLATSPDHALEITRFCLDNGPNLTLTGSERNAYFTATLSPRQQFIDLTEGPSETEYYNVLIAVQGNLRDRMLEQTVRETVRTLKCIGSRLWLDACLIGVTGWDEAGTKRTCFIHDPEWLMNFAKEDWNAAALASFDKAVPPEIRERIRTSRLPPA